jgi:hypothetical protein
MKLHTSLDPFMHRLYDYVVKSLGQMTYNNNTDVTLKSKTVSPTVVQNQHQGHGFTAQRVNAYKKSVTV